MRGADIYERKGAIFLCSSSRTTAGVGIISAPYFRVSSMEPAELGGLIRECLGASINGAPHPKSFSNLFSPILELAGVQTYSSFVKSAKYIMVSFNESAKGEGVLFSPTRNAGVDEGFLPLKDRLHADSDSDHDLGATALVALNSAR